MREFVKDWLVALRSGNYKQGTDRLATLDLETQQIDRFCCLGVACEIAGLPKTITDGVVAYGISDVDDSETSLPESFAEQLGIATEGMFFIDRVSDALKARIKEQTRRVAIDGSHICYLSWLNDQGCDFELIADIIEDVEKKELWWKP